MSLRRLHWGCGSITPEGLINSDIQTGPGVDLCCVTASPYPEIFELDSREGRSFYAEVFM